MSSSSAINTIYLIYDGDCILCNNCAQALKIKKSVGELKIINARSSHPLIAEAINKGYDLNEGIIVKYNDKHYYGVDAVHLLGFLSSPVDLVNRLNAIIFKSRILSNLLYPPFKMIRKLLLWLRQTSKITCTIDQAPISQIIFSDNYKNLDNIFRLRYANRIFTNDTITVKGNISIYYSKIFSTFSPLFRLSGVLAPYRGTDIPTSVKFTSEENSKKININRFFYFPNKKPYKFNSYLIHIKDNLIAEFIKYRFGWLASMNYEENKVKMIHRGYVIEIFNKLIPLPLSFILGKCYAEEQAISDTEFQMLMKITHPIFGRLFQYDGKFKLVDPLCTEKF